MKNKCFFKSLYHALEGFVCAYKEERNVRFHIFAAVNVFAFAAFYELDGSKWAILVLTVAAVISAELLNTALERAVDIATEEFMPTAKLAKDAAAASVFVLALGAVFIGIFLFGDVTKIVAAMKKIVTNKFILSLGILFEVVNIFLPIKCKNRHAKS